MMNASQRARLQAIKDKPWNGLLNYFRSMKADWDHLESLGYVTTRLVSNVNDVEIWEYAITDAGRDALLVKVNPHA